MTKQRQEEFFACQYDELNTEQSRPCRAAKDQVSLQGRIWRQKMSQRRGPRRKPYGVWRHDAALAAMFENGIARFFTVHLHFTAKPKR